MFVQPGSEPTLDTVRRDNFSGKRQKSGLRSSQLDAERLWRGAIGSRIAGFSPPGARTPSRWRTRPPCA
jgi:hypothetical protein